MDEIERTLREDHPVGNYAPASWLTTNEAAKLLGYADGSVLRHAIARGDILEGVDAIKRGNRWFVREAAARAYRKQMLDDFAKRLPPYRGPVPVDPDSDN